MPPDLAALGDDDLVERARSGSQEAMLELYRRYRPRIMSYAVRMTADRSAAEDVFHSTFVYFFQHLDRYEARGKLDAYLFRIARSAVADESVAARRARVAPAARPAEPAEPAEPELEARVRQALLKLSPELREVVALRLYDGLDYARVAEIAGVSEATARSRMRYALEALRKAMGQA